MLQYDAAPVITADICSAGLRFGPETLMTQDIRPDTLSPIASLAAIPEVKQRGYALAQRLAALENDEIISVVRAIRDKAALGHHNFLELYNALLFTGCIVEVLGRQTMAQLVDLAQARGESEIVSLLMDLPFPRSGAVTAQPYLDRELSEQPLGMRKALARKLDFRLIKRIALDQDHRVIRNLLDNPRLTEMDVIRIAATRPTSPKVLEEIYKHPRWITRYAVKRAIVLNPNAHTSIALRLLTFLNVQHLLEVAESPETSRRVVEEARRVAAKKTGSISESCHS